MAGRTRAVRALGLPAAALGFMLVVVAYAAVVDRPLGQLTRDPNQLTGRGALFGIVSTVGLLLWAGALALLWFAARADHPHRTPVLAWATLTALLMIDDGFLLHDVVLPDAGIPERAVYLGYGLGAVLVYVLARPLLAEIGAHTMVGAAAAALGTSVLADVLDVTTFGENALLAVEDGSKLVGIAFWVVAAHRAASALAAGRPEPAPAPEPADRRDERSEATLRALIELANRPTGPSAGRDATSERRA